MYSQLSEEERRYADECQRLWQEYGPELRRVVQLNDCDLDYEFLGFLQEYYCVDVPKDLVVLDFGCFTGIQAVYFQDNPAYIGIEPCCHIANRFRQDNIHPFEMTAQEFMRDVFPTLGLPPERCFAFCSWVPDDEAQQLVIDNFPYHRVVYGDFVHETLPEARFLEER